MAVGHAIAGECRCGRIFERRHRYHRGCCLPGSILSPELDDRFQVGKVTSRIGIEADALTFTISDNLLKMVLRVSEQDKIACVLVDEAQFLTESQVRQLSDLCDDHNIPVLAYGLRTDFRGELFEGSQHLLAWADSLVEVKTICHCGSKATMVLRIDADGRAIKDGRQVQIGGNERYLSVCRRHFKAGVPSADSEPHSGSSEDLLF